MTIICLKVAYSHFVNVYKHLRLTLKLKELPVTKQAGENCSFIISHQLA